MNKKYRNGAMMKPMRGIASMLKRYMNGGMMEYPGGGMVPKRMKYADGTMLTGDGDPEKDVSPAEALELLAARLDRGGVAYGSTADVARGDEAGGYTTAIDALRTPAMAAVLGLGEPEDQEAPKRPTVKKSFETREPEKEPKKPTVKKSFETREPEPVDDPADFSGGKSSYGFTPMFEGNIQQTGFRGPGTSGALTGVFMDFKNEDGTMDRVKTRLEDVPEYITKDPYFERLLEKANKKYFEMERGRGVSGAIAAQKEPEAQMIARILSGDITIEEAKRQANYQRQSF